MVNELYIMPHICVGTFPSSSYDDFIGVWLSNSLLGLAGFEL